MKNFLLKILFISLATGLFFFLFLKRFAGETTDAFYLRFATPKAPSLILGTSRAAQGIQPDIFNSSAFAFAKPIFNFSFTGMNSPYGPTYLEAIKKKIDSSSTNGLFILEVNPINLSVEKVNTGDDASRFIEKDLFLAKLHVMDVSPNVEYMARFYHNPYYSLVSNKVTGKEAIILRPDGWLEVNPPQDTAFINSRKRNGIRTYTKEFAENIRLSATRFTYLEKTIQYLQRFGKVVLVRLPIGPNMFQLEQKYCPDFDLRIQKLSRGVNARYINLFNLSGRFETNDESHLNKASIVKVSSLLLDSIKKEAQQ